MRNISLITILCGLFSIVLSWVLLGFCETVQSVNGTAVLTITGVFEMFFGTVFFIQNLILRSVKK